MENKNVNTNFVLSSTANFANSRANMERAIVKCPPNQQLCEEPMTTKSRYSEVIANSSDLEENIEQAASAPYLPNEMVEMILHRVNTADLLSLRKINRQWNQVSSRMMRGRDDITLHFVLNDEGHYIHRTKYRSCKRCYVNRILRNPRKRIITPYSKSLKDFAACLETSPLFPITSFRFAGMTLESFEYMTGFLAIWGDRIRAIKVCFNDSEENIKKLLELLVEKLPNLKKLVFCRNTALSISIYNDTKLHKFQRPELEVLCLYKPAYRKYFEILNSLPSELRKEISSSGSSSSFWEDWEILFASVQSIKGCSVCIRERKIAYGKRLPNRFERQLQSVSASEIVSQLFRSTRNTLQTLVSKPPALGKLSGIILPKFQQLRHLPGRRDLNQKDYQTFPLIFDWPGKFANIKELGKDTMVVYSNHSLNALSSVEMVRVSWNEHSQFLVELIKRTRNVETMSIRDKINFQSNQQYEHNISEEVPKLQSHTWQIRIPKSLRYKLDALVTGLPVNFSEILAEIFRNEDHLSGDEISRCWKRCNPSILDLKELRNLIFHACKSNDDDSDGDNESKIEEKALDKWQI